MFVTLTRFLDKATFYLGQGICIEPTMPREAARGALSKVTLHGVIHYVTEAPEEIVAKYEAMQASAQTSGPSNSGECGALAKKSKRFPVPAGEDAYDGSHDTK